MEGFRHIHPIEVRFRDIDVLGHVNNATTLTYVETARVPYIVALGVAPAQAGIGDISFIVAHINCDFRRPIFFGQRVEVGTRTVQVGRSSLKLEHRVEANGQIAAEGYCVLVHFDYRANSSKPVTPEMIARIEAFEGRAVQLRENS